MAAVAVILVSLCAVADATADEMVGALRLWVREGEKASQKGYFTITLRRWWPSVTM